jgi:hypothetical protein
MGKKINRTIAVFISGMLLVSSLSAFSVSANAIVLNGWATGSDLPTWAQNADATVQQQTRDAMTAEYNRLQAMSFDMGNPDPDSNIVNKDHDISVEFKGGNNIGNPWSQPNRAWGIIKAPFAGMAFSVNGYMAVNYHPWDHGAPLGNEFSWTNPSTTSDADSGTKTYQVMKSQLYIMDTLSHNVTTWGYNPGSNQNSNTNNVMSLVYSTQAFANFCLGRPAEDANKDGNIVYQEYFGPQSTGASLQSNRSSNGTALNYGISYIVMANDAATTGYVVKNNIFTAWAAQWGNLDTSNPDRFSVSGVPVGNEYDTQDGKVRQDFANESIIVDTDGVAQYLSNKNILSAFSVPNGITTVDGNNITVTVPTSTNITSLIPTFTISDGATVNIASGVSRDFTSDVTYIVTAADGTIATYTVSVIKQNLTDIIKFTVGGVDCIINYDTNNIAQIFSATVDLTSIAPTITLADAGATIIPASGVIQNFMNSVTYTVTLGELTKSFTVTLRKKSISNSINSFTIPKAQVKYATSDIVGTIDNTLKTITVSEPYGSSLSNVKPVITISDKASISPDGSGFVNLSTATYTVTSENGETAAYSVVINTGDPAPLPTVDSLAFTWQNAMSSFTNAEAASKQSILNEYNYQRQNAFDLGDPSGSIENWGDKLMRALFIGGMNKTSDGINSGVCGYIMMDVAGGRAYTLKNIMLSAWTSATTDNTQISYDKTGSPAVDEFVMDSALYQQFAYAYAKADEQGTAVTEKKGFGIGTTDSAFTTAVAGTTWVSPDVEKLRKNFRLAYELANQNNYNPGIALTGNAVYSAQADAVYQIFSGSGLTNSTTRNSSDTTIVLQGKVGDASAGALYGDMLTFWQNASNDEYVTIDVNAKVSGQTGVADNKFKFNKTIGAPLNSALIDKDGNFVQDFENGYISAPGGDFTKAVFSTGSRLSSDNRIKDFSLEGVTVTNKDFSARNENITFSVPTGTNLAAIKVKIELYDANATVNPISGSIVDLSFSNTDFVVTAQDGSIKHYYVTVNVGDETNGIKTTPVTNDSSKATPVTKDNSSNPSTGANTATNVVSIVMMFGALSVTVITKIKLLKTKSKTK